MDFLWFAAVIAAYFVKGVSGFANTLVFSSIMSFGTNNINISPVDLLIGIPPNAIMVWKNKSRIDPKICVPLSLLVAAGVIPGALFLKNTDVVSIKIVFGIVIILIGIQILLQELFIKTKENSKPNPVLLAVLGVISGVMCGLFGIGALLAAYVNKTASDSSAFKANMCIVFLVDNVIRFVLYTLWGILTFESYKIALFLLPGMVAGLLLGMLVGKKLNEKTMKIVVVILLIFSGISLIVNTLR